MSVIRWIRPAWLTLDQALIYSSLPPHVLRALLTNKRLRKGGRKIYRDSIDQVLLEASINRQVIFWLNPSKPRGKPARPTAKKEESYG